MKITSIFLCLFLWFFIPLSSVSALNLDGTALLSLVRHWKVTPTPLKSSWNSSHSTPCSWIGVSCNRKNLLVSLNLSGFAISGRLGPEIAYLKHLKTIDLSYNAFTGSIPSHLNNCSFLEYIDLSINTFSGKIPESIGNLPRLQYLSLWDNSLIGPIPDSLFRNPSLSTVYLNDNFLNCSIPSFVNMSSLQVLYLYSNRLSGTIPYSIGNCNALQELYLNNNLLGGSLPYSLNYLENLKSFFANDNNFTGEIELGFGNCKSMESLVLSNNQFSGSLPSQLGNCSGLVNLSAVNCNLIGPIPSSIGQLTRLELLYLSENHLSGKIPSELGKCESLSDLQMYDNHLEGSIPRELGSLNYLTTLMLFTNRLTGQIPISVWKIPSLENLIVYQNSLTGVIPEEITYLKQLKNVSLFDNRFNGVIPQRLGINSSGLTLLDFTRNNFTGPIPPNLCAGKQLKKLLLGQNSFQENIPSGIGSCFSLTRLILEKNNLTGKLPEFVENSNLLYMDVSGNKLSGSIPSSLGNAREITFIDLSSNKLNGQIPVQLGNLVNLEALNLSHNRLEYELPLSLSSCNKLSTLDVGQNLLNGSIPKEFRNLTGLSILDLSENRFTGGVPKFLFKLGKLSNLQLGANSLDGEISIGFESDAQSLRSLNLSHNGLTGRFPTELGKFTMLEQLDICCNNLSGNLETLTKIRSLTEVNVSYNFFDGPVPSDLMKMLILSPSSFLGNPNLCVNSLPNSTFKSCNTQSRKRDGLRKVDIALIVSGSLLFALILVLGASCLLLRNKSHDRELFVSAEEGASSLLNQIMRFTENLNERYIIGRGAHGTVYKATLGQDKVYAVKKLEILKGGSKSMVREIETIGKVRHRNLVKLEDYWLRKEYGLILYSYMKNGSLYDVLHETGLLLEWNVRHKIAVGTAMGLSYLHFDCDPAIVHRDIKSKNILLDSDFEPRISDFGIAKLLDQSVGSTLSSAVQGTTGYMAPERAYSIKSSKESDVYAYGVVLLEIITRKKVLDPSFGGEIDIVSWVRSVWNTSEDLEMIVDPNIFDELLDKSIYQQVKVVLLLALGCTEKELSKRPSMRDVVKQLTQDNYVSRSKHA